jgi:hypothetical protein
VLTWYLATLLNAVICFNGFLVNLWVLLYNISCHLEFELTSCLL